jgi:hypothetical protein
MKWFGISVRSAVVAAVAVVMVGVAMASMAGCAGEDEMELPLEEPGLTPAEQQMVYNEWRVDMIVGSLPDYDISAEYTYDDAGRLVSANVSEENTLQQTGTRYEERFEWRNDRPVKQFTHRKYSGNGYREDFELDFETTYDYDSRGLLMHRDGENPPGKRQYEYDTEGRLVQTYSYEFAGITYRDRLEWDDRGNVVKHIMAEPESTMFETPIPGTYRESVFEYEYDNYPKPNFGLSDAFFWDGRYSPWPFSGNSSDELARTLSRNNITRCEAGGLAFRYTYNEYGLPATVTVIRTGTRASALVDEPMTRTIVYKRIEN